MNVIASALRSLNSFALFVVLHLEALVSMSAMVSLHVGDFIDAVRMGVAIIKLHFHLVAVSALHLASMPTMPIEPFGNSCPKQATHDLACSRAIGLVALLEYAAVSVTRAATDLFACGVCNAVLVACI